MTNNLRALHLVQIGHDDSVFVENAPSDTRRRQIEYGEELERQRPGSRMSVLIFTADSTARRFENANVVFIPIPRRGLTALFARLNALHRECPIDVIATQTIHAEAWLALLFGALNDVNVVGQIHYDIFSAAARQEVLGGGIFGGLKYALSLRLMRRMVAVRVVGQRIRERILAEGLHANVYVLPVPVTMVVRENAEERITPAPRVLFVGRLIAAKNLYLWLQVARRVAEQDATVTFEIVGDGELRHELEAEANRLGIAARVRFAGALTYDQLPEVYRAARVFLLTSRYEGFGRVVAEAYLNGVPVVAPRITGVEDIVADGQTGFLHDSADGEGMAASVLRLLHDDQLRAQMGQAGRTLVRVRFDPQRLAREWVALLVSAARTPTPDPSSIRNRTEQGRGERRGR